MAHFTMDDINVFEDLLSSKPSDAKEEKEEISQGSETASDSSSDFDMFADDSETDSSFDMFADEPESEVDSGFDMFANESETEPESGFDMFATTDFNAEVEDIESLCPGEDLTVYNKERVNPNVQAVFKLKGVIYEEPNPRELDSIEDKFLFDLTDDTKHGTKRFIDEPDDFSDIDLSI